MTKVFVVSRCWAPFSDCADGDVVGVSTTFELAMELAKKTGLSDEQIAELEKPRNKKNSAGHWSCSDTTGGLSIDLMEVTEA